MAVTYWEGGGTDDKFGTANNWSDGVPGTGDVAVVNDSAVDIPAEDYTTAFGELRIGSGFTGSIGVIPIGVAQATATVTITDYTELNTGDKVNLIATDGNNYDFVNGDQSSAEGTWESNSSNDGTATNLMNVINTSSGDSGTRFTATVDGAVVTITQATAGADGDTTVTLTDSGTVGMTKTNFTGGSDEVALSVTCDSVVIDTGANAYIDATATLVTIERTANGDDAVRLTGDVDTLRVLGARGTVVLGEAAALAVDDLEILGGRSAVVEVQSLTTLAAAPISMDEGLLEFRGMAAAATGQFDLIGGRMDLYGGDFDTVSMEIWNRVVINDYRDDDSSIGTIHMFGGTWNGTGATADLLTIDTLRLYEDATFDERNGLLNYAYTNGVHFAGSGRFHAATGRKITEA